MLVYLDFSTWCSRHEFSNFAQVDSSRQVHFSRVDLQDVQTSLWDYKQNTIGKWTSRDWICFIIVKWPSTFLDLWIKGVVVIKALPVFHHLHCLAQFQKKIMSSNADIPNSPLPKYNDNRQITVANRATISTIRVIYDVPDLSRNMMDGARRVQW